MLKAVDIYKSYGQLQVLKGVSLEMSRGENVCIVGPSGSGKSTLLQIIGTLDSPTSGDVSITGQNPFSLSEKDLAKFRGETIGFIFQRHGPGAIKVGSAAAEIETRSSISRRKTTGDKAKVGVGFVVTLGTLGTIVGQNKKASL